MLGSTLILARNISIATVAIVAVATLTDFPRSFVAGDAVRVTISDSRYLSSLFTLKVWFQTPTAAVPFTAPAGTGGSYDLFITSAQSAALASGQYLVGLVYTEIALPNDRITGCEFTVTVYANPAVAEPKSQARLTLEAMEAAWLVLASGANQTVNFNGQSFTKRNLKEFNDMIEQQRAIVVAEDAARLGHRKINRILHPL